jgi:hypothetical protein
MFWLHAFVDSITDVRGATAEGAWMSDWWERVEVPHCSQADCKGRSVNHILAIWIVTLVACIVLAPRLIASTGATAIGGGVGTEAGFHFDTILYLLGLVLAITLGSTRKHESPIWCFVDSVGLPVVVALLVGLKGVTH